MIRWLALLSARFRLLVLAGALVLTGLGLAQLRQATVDTYPEFGPVQVQIQTEALGLSAAEVEQLVTVPLEQDLLNGVAWLDQIQSVSAPGLSSIDLVFQPGTDEMKARQLVNERLTQAAALPSVGTPPVMLQPLSSAARVMMIGLSSPDQPLVDLSVLARWKIKPRLMGVPGVANVAIFGQRDRQLQVRVDPARLHRHGVTLTQVIDTAANALWVSSLTFVEASTPGTGGFIESGGQRFAIQHVLPITTARGLASVAMEDAPKNLQLGDVADVVEGYQPLIGDSVLGGRQGLMLVVEKFPGADTRRVTQGVENALAGLRPGLGDISIDTDIYRPATFIQTALHNLRVWTAIGFLLAIAALGLLFWSWRTAVIAAVTLPVSLVTAAYVLYLRGATFNLMLLAGLAAALGIVVDEAVMGVAAWRDGNTARVRGSLTYALLVVLLAVVPVYLLTGVAGAFARPLVVAYALAALAAAGVALVVTPALAATLRPPPSRGPLASWADRAVALLGPVMAGRPWRACLAALVLAVTAGLAVLPQLGGPGRTPLPIPQDRHLLVHWQAAPGTSLPEMTRITDRIVRELRTVGGVRDVGAHVGRALLSDQIGAVDSGELWVTLSPSAPYDPTLTSIRRVLAGYPGMRSSVETYEQDRIRAAEPGGAGGLVVRTYGQDLDTLHATAQRISRMLGSVQGLSGATVQSLAEQPTLRVTVDLAAAQRYGLKPGDVRRAAAAFFAGLPVGSLYEDQKIFDVVVWSTPALRDTPSDLTGLLIDTPDGGQVRLGDVATVRVAPFPTVIRHDATSRYLDVTARVSGRDLGAVEADVRGRLARLAMPYEYHAEVLGDAAARQGNDQRTLVLVAGMLVVIFFVLQAAVRSWRLAGLLLVLLPLACAGGAPAALLAGPGQIRSAGALSGLLLVLGIASRYCLILAREFQRRGRTEILTATREHAGRMLATVVATAMALLPAVFAGSAPGAEVLHPLAVVALGGLVTAPVSALLVLPALCMRLVRVEVNDAETA
jgi:Cu/Ag efflux pump CusA